MAAGGILVRGDGQERHVREVRGIRCVVPRTVLIDREIERREKLPGSGLMVGGRKVRDRTREEVVYAQRTDVTKQSSR